MKFSVIKYSQIYVFEEVDIVGKANHPRVSWLYEDFVSVIEHPNEIYRVYT